MPLLGPHCEGLRPMPIPVVFIATANDPDHPLAALSEELRAIRAALDPAVRAHVCKVVERPAADLFTIADVFRDHAERIMIFHFAGHGDAHSLVFEQPDGAGPVGGEGLAEFLGHQRALKLVFLNACATHDHVKRLQRAGVPLVIATSEDIADDVAPHVAATFYRGLAANRSVGTAFAEAQSLERSRLGDSLRRAYHPGYTGSADHWPWDLYVRPGADGVLTWSLAEGAGDPLFGLPSPSPGDLPDVPFRHLRWYGAEHADVFFGRGADIRRLYES